MSSLHQILIQSTPKVLICTAKPMPNSRVSSAPLSTHRWDVGTHRSHPACARSRTPAGRTLKTRKSRSGGRGRRWMCRFWMEEGLKAVRTPTGGGSGALPHRMRRGMSYRRDETCMLAVAVCNWLRIYYFSFNGVSLLSLRPVPRASEWHRGIAARSIVIRNSKNSAFKSLAVVGLSPLGRSPLASDFIWRIAAGGLTTPPIQPCQQCRR